MLRAKPIVFIILITLLLGGCSLNSNARDNSREIRHAKLTELSVQSQKDIILNLSNSISLNKQIEANLLLPNQPVWKGERQENDPLFKGYKYEIVLHDIIPELTPKQKFGEVMIFQDTVGPIQSVQGVFPPDDSLAIIYVGIGQENAKIKIQDIGKNKVLISIYK
ncbi:hypothetical protein ACHOLT_11625 [Desulfitobacterium sp. Sab5]|uniref:hypothetical protein n=1 Tax=Desulfitobacterium nosdiversum TaxID=3375356 RepID=UPI003CECD62B